MEIRSLLCGFFVRLWSPFWSTASAGVQRAKEKQEEEKRTEGIVGLCIQAAQSDTMSDNAKLGDEEKQRNSERTGNARRQGKG